MFRAFLILPAFSAINFLSLLQGSISGVQPRSGAEAPPRGVAQRCGSGWIFVASTLWPGALLSSSHQGKYFLKFVGFEGAAALSQTAKIAIGFLPWEALSP